ncbi:MAG: hypothetical protein H6621_07525 [Halobacteriovoraceae bacterium]|nr:hypothetical protein [Halobacteriovoraceae bacterium]
MRYLSTLLALIIATSSFAGTYNFGAGACSSQGEWTRRALDQNKQLIDQLETLRTNPACQGIESILDLATTKEVNKITDSFRENSQGNSANVNDILNTLSGELQTGADLSPGFLSVLFGKTVESSLLNDSNGSERTNGDIKRVQRAQTAVHKGMNILDAVLNKLPQYDECLYNHPDVAISILSAASGLISSYMTSGYAPVNRVSSSLRNIVKFLQDRRFSRAYRTLGQSEFLSSMSCVLETTTANYCRARDAYEILKYVDEIQKIKDEAVTTDKPTPLEGYFLLTREVPIISKWVQKVQLGVTPRLYTDGEYKSQIFDNINDLLQQIAKLQGAFSDQKDQYYGLKVGDGESLLRAKKSHVLNIISEIASKMAGGRNDNARGSVNFFERVIPSSFIPFALVGIKDIPEEVGGVGDRYQKKIDWRSWMELNGTFQPFFNDPDELLESIEKNMNALIEDAHDAGGDYFQQRLIVDIPNLVDDSLTSQTITVVDALKRVYRYLDKLGIRMEQDLRGTPYRDLQAKNWSYLTFIDQSFEDLPVYGNIQSTKLKIQKILKRYKELSQKIATNIDKKIDEDELKKLATKRLKELSKKYDVSFFGLDTTETDKKFEEIQKKYHVKYKALEQKDQQFKDQKQKWKEPSKHALVPVQEINGIVDELLADDEVKKLYYDIVDTVYEEFNILYQRDTFLMTRMSTFVKYDMSYYVKNKIEMSDYQRDLMLVAGQNLITNDLNMSLEENPNRVARDLDQAMEIGEGQLMVLERLFGDTLVPYLVKLKKIEDNDRITGISLTGDALKRLINDSMNWGLSPSKFFYNVFYHKRRYTAGVGLFDFNRIESDDNIYGSFKNLRAKLCLQTLAFRDKADYYPYCEGTVLDSFMEDLNDTHGYKLNARYNQELYKYTSALSRYSTTKSSDDLQAKRKAHFDNVCALRDYDRRNYAFWLIQNLGNL